MLEIRVQMPESAKQKGLRMQALLFEVKSIICCRFISKGSPKIGLRCSKSRATLINASARKCCNGGRARVPRGDAHHSNILDFGERGWLAIDPKRVTGERYYDYGMCFAALICQAAHSLSALQDSSESSSQSQVWSSSAF